MTKEYFDGYNRWRLRRPGSRLVTMRWIAALQLVCAVVMLLFVILTLVLYLLALRDQELTALHLAYPDGEKVIGSADVITHHALAALVVATVGDLCCLLLFEEFNY